jgi:hypothetical protein
MFTSAPDVSDYANVSDYDPQIGRNFWRVQVSQSMEYVRMS